MEHGRTSVTGRGRGGTIEGNISRGGQLIKKPLKISKSLPKEESKRVYTVRRKQRGGRQKVGGWMGAVRRFGRWKKDGNKKLGP